MPKALVLASAVALGVVAFANDANAEVVIGVEGRGEVKATDAGPIRGGPSVLASIGYAFDTYPILVLPEAAVTAAVWPADRPFFPGRAVAGIRFGFTAVVEPQIYTHGGYGFIFHRGDVSHGFALDAGFGLDYRVQREITVGGVAGYEGLFAGKASAHGGTFGVRVGFWL
jgi:hypothetical protein